VQNDRGLEYLGCMKGRGDSGLPDQAYGKATCNSLRIRSVAWRLWVMVWMPLWIPVLAGSESDLRLQVLLPDGRPAGGAMVRASGCKRNGPRSIWRAVADSAGQWVLPVECGSVDDGCLLVAVPGYALGLVRLGQQGGWRSKTEGAIKQVTLTLQPPFAVAGRVVDEHGSGVADARVITVALGVHTYQTLRLGDPRSDAWPELSASTDADGRFQLPGFTTDPTATLMAGSVGWVAIVRRDQRLWIGEGVGSVRREKTGAEKPARVLEIRPSVSLRGRVTDGGGGPLGEVRVGLSGIGDFDFDECVTKADGRFEFTEVPAFARPRLSMERDGFAPVQVFQPDARPRTWLGRTPELEVAMGRPVRLQGKVVDGFTGAPTLVPVEISIRQVFEQSLGWVAETSATAWSEEPERPEVGGFDVRIPAGPVRIHVTTSIVNGAYQRPYEHEFREQVPTAGTMAMELKVPRRPGVLVQLESKDPQGLRRYGYGGDLLVYVREAQSLGVSGADLTPLWFFPLPAWGEKAETRWVRRRSIAPEQTEDHEILPWTELVADPAKWPVRMTVP
jgi:hypothetical protein